VGNQIFSALLERRNQFVVFAFDVFNEFVLGTGSPRSGSMEHFIKNEAKGPDVAFGSVRLRLEDLGRHVQRSPDGTLDFEGFIFFFSEAKIANFRVAFGHHDIGRF
jgi:hypothetical protein